MIYKQLTLDIPEPDENGYCNHDCDLYVDTDHGVYCMKYYSEIIERLLLMKPSKGCPWYDM